MTLSSISSSYLNSALLPAVRQAQSQLANLEIESSTGEYADLGQHLGNQSGYELSLRTQDDLLQTMKTANGVTATNLSTAQTALTSLQSSAVDTASSLLTWSPNSATGLTLQSYGQGQLQQLTSLANTSAAGGYLFAGQNSAVPPLSDFASQPTSAAKTALDAAFQSNFGFSTSSPQVANITADDMKSFLAGPFAAEFQGQKWTDNWSSASSVNSAAEITPGHTVETTSSVNTSGFQMLARGYSMLSELGGIGLNANAQQAVASAAVSVLNQGAAAITSQAAGIGLVQSDLSHADDNMQGQMQILQTQINRSDAVDPATIATELTTLTNQLQAAYQLTAKIHSMNLAQYLPA